MSTFAEHQEGPQGPGGTAGRTVTRSLGAPAAAGCAQACPVAPVRPPPLTLALCCRHREQHHGRDDRWTCRPRTKGRREL